MLNPISHLQLADVEKLLSCVLLYRRVPSVISDLSQRMRYSKYPLNIHFDSILDLIAEICDLRALVREASVSDPFEIIPAFLAVDKQLTVWSQELPSRWNYRTICTLNSPYEVYEGAYHVYANVLVASTWNLYRGARMLVNSAILHHLKTLHFDSESSEPCYLRDQRAQSRSVVSEMALNICASIPYLLGYGSSSHDQADFLPPVAAALFLLPPLPIAACWAGVPRSMKEYVIGRLLYIGNTLGISLAFCLAEVVRNALDCYASTLLATTNPLEEG
jgi:hypothetical protein